jgi:hypothetical protein
VCNAIAHSEQACEIASYTNASESLEHLGFSGLSLELEIGLASSGKPQLAHFALFATYVGTFPRHL